MEMIREGGMGAYAAIALGLISLALGALAAVAMLGKSRSAFSLGIATLVMSALVAGTGMLGTVYGRHQVTRAVAAVGSGLNIERILHQGYREAQASSLIGFFMSLLPLALGAAAAFVGSRMQKPKSRMQGFAEPVVSTDDGVGGQSILALAFIGIAALASGGAWVMAHGELPKLRYSFDFADSDSWALAGAIEDVQAGQRDGCQGLQGALEPFWSLVDRHDWPRKMRPISPELAAWRAAADTCAKKIADELGTTPAEQAQLTRDDLLQSPLLQDEALHARLLAAAVEKPKAVPAQVTAQATLSKDQIQKTIRSELKAITSCYERELVKTPKLGGKIAVKLVIGSDGRVVEAEEDSDEPFPAPRVTACVLARVKMMKFPQPQGGGLVRVKYPFIFMPAE